MNVEGEVFIPSGATLSRVVEKVTSTDNAVVRFDGTTGTVQNSGVIIDDNNNIMVSGNNYPNITLTNINSSSTFPLIALQDLRTNAHSWNIEVGRSGSALSFRDNNASDGVYERMRIDSAGNVGIGVTPSAWIVNSTVSALHVNRDGVLYSGYAFNNNQISVGTGFYYNSSLNPIYKNTYATSEYIQAAGNHYWRTAPSGTAGNAITWTNAMTLDNSGNLLVGANTNGMNNTTGFNVTNPSTSAYCSIGHISGTPSGVVYLNFSYNGTQIGSIYQSGTSSVVYATTSDYRLKENIRPADCKKFMDIKFVDYERIDGRHECGVIAHELQEIYPDLVTGEKDATEIRKVEISPAVEEAKDEDGNIIVEAVEAVYEEQEFPVYQQVNYMGLIARIGTVVQQQAKLIEAMRAEIDELKGIGGAK